MSFITSVWDRPGSCLLCLLITSLGDIITQVTGFEVDIYEPDLLFGDENLTSLLPEPQVELNIKYLDPVVIKAGQQVIGTLTPPNSTTSFSFQGLCHSSSNSFDRVSPPAGHVKVRCDSSGIWEAESNLARLFKDIVHWEQQVIQDPDMKGAYHDWLIDQGFDARARTLMPQLYQAA